ncbi:MAG: hypothetical protein OEY67_03725 [Gammaproteobacteria bacterium]|nr:hypothetical protein [Gammaproteobacteria bacterium]
MEILWFTATGIVLYVVSDAILRKIEDIKGKTLANRSIIFFAIFLPLTLISFQLIQYLLSSSQ